MFTPDTNNISFQLAADFITKTNQSVFLTGKAGTGKTTFLKYIRGNTTKNTAVVAPTGVAAMNAGGTTIHSFFQLPFSPFLPDGNNHFGVQPITDKHDLISKLRLTTERKEIMQQLELLIIDEISMVRCDVLDAIDTVLKYVRSNAAKPFGGVQVLYIGDMYQLPPVVKDEEWQLLNSHYANQFFFSSRVVSTQQPVYIELNKIYRQSDSKFIGLLNQVRNNEMEQEGYELLHSRYRPDFKATKEEKFITLATHNFKADAMNAEALAALREKQYQFNATIEGTFSESAYPADEMLRLKVGAQVMFLKNDTEKVRRYYNGKIGTVKKIEDDKIFVECVEEGSTTVIEVKKETWKNISYSLNKTTRHIEEEELGSFSQYPLRLAWAITIHKSQGLTFDKLMIDAGKAFAPGQVYVALSRCTSLEGIVLLSKISYSSLQSDPRILAFAKSQQSIAEKSLLLQNSTKHYEHEIILNIFDYSKNQELLYNFTDWLMQQNNVSEKVMLWMKNFKSETEKLFLLSTKFLKQLSEIFSKDGLTEKENDFLHQRIIAGSNYFLDELGKIRPLILQSPFVSDSRQFAKDHDSKLQLLFDENCLKIFLTGMCKAGFNLDDYLKKKAAFSKIPFPLNSYSGRSAYVPNEILHPELYNLLKQKRDEICNDKNLSVYMVCSSASIEQMTIRLPQTLHDLGNISGFGIKRLKQFGNGFVNIIKDYCELHHLQSDPTIQIKKIQRPKKLSDKPDTKKLSFDLYKQGKTIAEIATDRGFAQATIEGHLAHFVETGNININELVDAKTQKQIQEVIVDTGVDSFQKIKEKLPRISYGHIKWVVAASKQPVT